MNAAIDSIIENLRAIKIVTEPTPDSFKTDRIQTSNGREFTIQEFIARYFPATYSVKKGPIYSKTSPASSEIDCVLLAPNHPVLTTPIREVIIAEGVHAAIELKPDIKNNAELKRSLQQVKSVKRLERSVSRLVPLKILGQKEANKYFDKIPTFLFSFVSKPAEDTIKFLLEEFKNGELEMEDFPDFIVTLDNGIIAFTPFAKECMFHPIIKSNFEVFPDKLFLHFITKEEETLALFLFILYSVLPPEAVISEFILRKYISPVLNNYHFDVYAVNNEDAAKVVAKKK